MQKAVEIKGLSFAYPSGAQALSSIDLEVLEGESVAIIGPNGSGKSTLIKIIEGSLCGEGFVRVLSSPGILHQQVHGLLSEGENRYAAAEQLLMSDIAILCLDEPINGLDAKHRDQLVSLIREKEGTKIISTRDLELAFETCSKIVLINGGEIIKQGPAADILRDAILLEENDLEVPFALVPPKNPGLYPIGNN